MASGKADLNRGNGFAVNMGFLYTFSISLGEDVAGRTFHFDVKEKHDASGYLLQLTNVLSDADTGIYVSDEATGELTVRINTADSDDLTRPGAKPYEFWYESGGEHIIVFEGVIEFTTGSLS